RAPMRGENSEGGTAGPGSERSGVAEGIAVGPITAISLPTTRRGEESDARLLLRRSVDSLARPRARGAVLVRVARERVDLRAPAATARPRGVGRPRRRRG